MRLIIVLEQVKKIISELIR